MAKSTNYTLLTPGPVPCPPEVLAALSLPVMHHRVPEFEAILKRVLAGLKNVFQTQQAVMIHTSTGSGAMESALVNTLSPNDPILCVVSGKFGERWAEMAKVYGLQVVEHRIAWGEKLDLNKFEDTLKKNPTVKAVLTQVCETSTATIHPVKEMTALVRKHTPIALMMCDAITAIGTTPFAMDAWDIDVTVAGSQKAFMIPTGLSFIALSEKAWAAQRTAKLPKFYFDLAGEVKANTKNQTYFSSSVSLIRGLDLALKYFAGAKLKSRIKHAEKLMTGTHKAIQKMGLTLYSQSPSPSVTAINVPNSIDGIKLRDLLEKKYHVTVMGGQDQLTGKIIRVGHLGYIQNKDMTVFIKALAKALNELGFEVSKKQEAQALKEFK